MRVMLRCTICRERSATVTPRLLRPFDWNDRDERTRHQGPTRFLAGPSAPTSALHTKMCSAHPLTRRVQQATSLLPPHRHAISAWRQRQEVLREMQMMTDRELADIGLSRGDWPAYSTRCSPRIIVAATITSLTDRPDAAITSVVHSPFLNASLKAQAMPAVRRQHARACERSRPDRIAVPPGANANR